MYKNSKLIQTYIRGVGDQLPEEDLFVGIEGVDNQGHQLSDLCLEGKGLSLLLLVHFFRHLHKKTKRLSKLPSI